LYPSFMTLCYSNNICLFAMLLLYSNFIFDIAMIYYEFKHSFVELLVHYLGGLGGRKYVSMVLRYDLPANTSYNLGHVVDRGGDSPVESYAVHSFVIRLVEYDYEDFLAMFLIFLMNRSGCKDSMLVCYT
jgi:hypothetical protein